MGEAMLTDDELLRYSRQILLAQVDIEGQLRLKRSRALIVGLGGLGSPVALYLAAAGVGELHLADFDTVDITNLQRQIVHDTASVGQRKVDSAASRLLAINPQLQVQRYPQGLDADSLAAAVAAVDLVLDCSDNFSTRQAVNAACVAAGKPLVSGAAIRLEGQLAVFDPRQAQSPCYHCLYGHGSEAELTCSEAGVLGPLVGLVGSLQALEALKLLAGFGEPLVWNDDHILTSTAERGALKRLQALGLHDAFRLHHDEAGHFSWWDYRQAGFRRNLGLRIDLTLVSDALRDGAAASGIDREPRTWDRPSDHAPAWVALSG